LPLSIDEAKVEHVYKPVEFHSIPQVEKNDFTTFSSSKKAFFEESSSSSTTTTTTTNKHVNYLKPEEETIPTPPIFEMPEKELEILQPQPSEKPDFKPDDIPTINAEDHVGYRPHVPVHQYLPRTPSPRPSSEAVEMERIWAHPHANQMFYSTESHQEHHEHHHHHEHHVQEPPVEEPVRTQSIKETTQMFEEKIKQLEQSELKAPALIKQVIQPKPIQVEVPQVPGLEPGEPPEICFAPKQVFEKKTEKFDATVYETFDKEPNKVLPGAVKIIPPVIATPSPIKPEPIHPHIAEQSIAVQSTKDEVGCVEAFCLCVLFFLFSPTQRSDAILIFGIFFLTQEKLAVFTSLSTEVLIFPFLYAYLF
jgi:hypothetical protein